MEPDQFNKKTVVITGAASGIGYAVAVKLAKLGANIIVLDNHADKADEITASLTRFTHDVFFIKCDVSVEAEVKSALDFTAEKYNHIDFAFNNAGIGGEFAILENYPTDDWQRVMGINVTGVFLCMKYQLPLMRQHSGAAIVNTASFLSTVGYCNDSAYVASKFAVLGLTKNAALEYAPKGIRINAVSPGFTRTPMIDNGDPEKLEHLRKLHPIGRLATADEIADAVLWLFSKQSSFTVGTNLMVDGGYTIA